MRTLKKKVLFTAVLTIVLAVAIFLGENVFTKFQPIVTRNTYGEGKKTEKYALTIEDEVEDAVLELEIEERAYTQEETQEVFQKVLAELDTVILGDNESLDRVEKDLHLVTTLENYPVEIQWELSSYSVMSPDGKIQEENLSEEGTLLELRGTVSYGEEKTVYVRNAMLYPVTREGIDKMLYDVRQALLAKEAGTREEASFTLPSEVNGKTLKWNQKKEQRWYYILLMGAALCIFFVYKEREVVKKKEKERYEELLRQYPGMISKFTMLLSTGTTVKHAWEKMVHNYEEQKASIGNQLVYEEMKTTLYEMQGGIPEAEAYERFGKRCNATTYLKFGAQLSQNLRKGSKGISNLLRMEAIQAFENRKSIAKRRGEEAGTKLLMPMMGMLAIVLIMVMVPAFLTMQL